jgi:hypothetical protein
MLRYRLVTERSGPESGFTGDGSAHLFTTDLWGSDLTSLLHHHGICCLFAQGLCFSKNHFEHLLCLVIRKTVKSITTPTVGSMNTG